MIRFIDEHRDDYGVEPICQQLPLSVSTYYWHKEREQQPKKLAGRVKRDQQLVADIRRVWDENHQVYGARKVWLQLNNEDIAVARCSIERLMQQMGIRGVSRASVNAWTTISDADQAKPLDRVNRQFVADRPNQLWVADITYVATWTGFVYAAFIIDVYSRYIVGWRVGRSLETPLVLDALEQAIWYRKPEKGLIHHSDHGSQYLSIRYTERLVEAEMDASVGSVGDSYDNAMAETINGLYKTEVIRHKGPWKGIDEVEYATLTWIDWFNNRRLLRPIGDRSPAAFEKLYYEKKRESAKAA